MVFLHLRDEVIMNHRAFIAIAIILLVITAIGCSSSEESTSGEQSQKVVYSPTPVPKQPVERPPLGEDTVSVAVQSTPRHSYEPPPIPESTRTERTGTYSVQIGAYREEFNAEQIASLARDRFKMHVSVSNDRVNALFKVMIGDFTTKEDARAFRDRMSRQFPGEYNDAWVSERPDK